MVVQPRPPLDGAAAANRADVAQCGLPQLLRRPGLILDVDAGLQRELKDAEDGGSWPFVFLSWVDSAPERGLAVRLASPNAPAIKVDTFSPNSPAIEVDAPSRVVVVWWWSDMLCTRSTALASDAV